jgi:hypothetical protein
VISEWKFQACRRGVMRHLLWCALAVLCAKPGLSQGISEFHKTFSVSLAEPVKLDIELFEGDVEIAYSRKGEVSISAVAQTMDDANIPADFLSTLLSAKAIANRIEVREQFLKEAPHGRIKVAYRIGVPYSTEVHSVIRAGKQKIIGVMGPVTVQTNEGDIQVSYVSKAVVARTGLGNLDLHVIGEHLEAQTGRGKISCSRAAQGLSAETEDGDISLMVVGPSAAAVKHGTGRIDVGGVRGTLVASTDAGDLHVKAVPREDWQLSSRSGTVRVELPPSAGFELHADTASGELSISRADMDKPPERIGHFVQKANGGGKRIQLRTESGRIVVM